ncbi:MAG: GntP family permease [Candidatus Glassbacteria bacterium]|nr:GntP family permease [Candidatus Glassbacteria bacterium]
MSGPGLLLVLVLLVVIIMLATGRWRADAFLLLIACAFVFGISAGMGIGETLGAINKGFGGTLGGVGLVIIFGAVIGAFLERTGASGSIASAMLRLVGKKRTPLAMSLTGFVVSIPVFCDSGFIVLVPLVKALARKAAAGRLTLAVALATGLYAAHCLVPPTPGPIAAAVTVGADIGRVIVLGLPIALVLAIVGNLWAGRFSGELLPDEQLDQAQPQEMEPAKMPGIGRSVMPIAVPLMLITLGSLFGQGESAAAALIKGIGHPVFALGAGLTLAFALPGGQGERGSWIAAGIKSCAIVLAVTAAGGAFGNVIRLSSLGGYIQEVLGGWQQAGVLVPFVLSAALKSAQGSSTVAMITSAAIVAPLLDTLGLGAGEWGPALAVVAIGCGSMTVSHANDSYFWVVSQMAGIPVPTAYRTYTTATGLMGFTGAVLTLLVSLVLL